MAEDKIKILEERLTRLEAALTQRPSGTGGFTAPGGVIVDPAPYGGGYGFHPRPWGGGYGYPRWPPYVDPAPWPPYVDPAPWPPYVADPAPWPGTVSDPAPYGGGAYANAAITARILGRIGHVGDPAPIDFTRLSVSQLESTLHSINAEKARLDSLETMVKKQLEQATRQEKK